MTTTRVLPALMDGVYTTTQIVDPVADAPHWLDNLHAGFVTDYPEELIPALEDEVIAVHAEVVREIETSKAYDKRCVGL